MTVDMRRSLQEVVDQTTDRVLYNVESETKRAHHGRAYPSRRERGAIHIASAPGESFATDTESLIASMKQQKLAVLTNEIQLNDERWAIFEFGGARIAARPTIIPTMTHMQDQFSKDCFEAVMDAAMKNQV